MTDVRLKLRKEDTEFVEFTSEGENESWIGRIAEEGRGIDENQMVIITRRDNHLYAKKINEQGSYEEADQLYEWDGESGQWSESEGIESDLPSKEEYFEEANPREQIKKLEISKELEEWLIAQEAWIIPRQFEKAKEKIRDLAQARFVIPAEKLISFFREYTAVDDPERAASEAIRRFYSKQLEGLRKHFAFSQNEIIEEMASAFRKGAVFLLIHPETGVLSEEAKQALDRGIQEGAFCDREEVTQFLKSYTTWKFLSKSKEDLENNAKGIAEVFKRLYQKRKTLMRLKEDLIKIEQSVRHSFIPNNLKTSMIEDLKKLEMESEDKYQARQLEEIERSKEETRRRLNKYESCQRQIEPLYQLHDDLYSEEISKWIRDKAEKLFKKTNVLRDNILLRSETEVAQEVERLSSDFSLLIQMKREKLSEKDSKTRWKDHKLRLDSLESKPGSNFFSFSEGVSLLSQEEGIPNNFVSDFCWAKITEEDLKRAGGYIVKGEEIVQGLRNRNEGTTACDVRFRLTDKDHLETTILSNQADEATKNSMFFGVLQHINRVGKDAAFFVRGKAELSRELALHTLAVLRVEKPSQGLDELKAQITGVDVSSVTEEEITILGNKFLEQYPSESQKQSSIREESAYARLD